MKGKKPIPIDGLVYKWEHGTQGHVEKDWLRKRNVENLEGDILQHI